MSYTAIHLEPHELLLDYKHPPYQRSFDFRINSVYEKRQRIFLDDINGIPRIELVRSHGRFLVMDIASGKCLRFIYYKELVTYMQIAKLYDDMNSVGIEIKHICMNT